ncbi:MAG TPA: hypothetical protein DEF34_10230 [Desulfotomaculum sp.]|nr:hypothetical protein [Desulfotomaculum sp.]
MDQQTNQPVETLEEIISNFELLIQEKRSHSTEQSLNSQAEYQCRQCQDHGIIFDDNKNAAYPCRCQENRKRERMFKNSRITPAFKSKTLDNFNTQGRPPIVKKMLQSARHYVSNFGTHGENNWLVCLGEPGCGKTHLSLAVANTLLTSDVQVMYFPHVEGMSELKNTFSKNEETLEEKLRELRNVDVLVWDDLFKGRKEVTPWTIEIVFDALNYRYLNLLPTIISSEWTPEMLLNLDKAIGSRILERGKGHLVVVEGIDCNFRLA